MANGGYFILDFSKYGNVALGDAIGLTTKDAERLLNAINHKKQIRFENVIFDIDNHFKNDITIISVTKQFTDDGLYYYLYGAFIQMDGTIDNGKTIIFNTSDGTIEGAEI